jgi:hypothetical protein
MGIRVIFDESRASVTSPVPYTKLFSAISADLRCAERWRPGIKMRFIEDGMSVLGHSQQIQSAPKSIDVRSEQPFDIIVDGHAPGEPPSPSPSITRRRTPAALAVGVHPF